MELNLITVEEAAVRLGCSASTVRRRIEAGHLSAKRIYGRQLLEPKDVDKLKASEERT